MCNANGLRPKERRRIFLFFERKRGFAESSEASEKHTLLNKSRKKEAVFIESSHIFAFSGVILWLFAYFT